MELTTDSRPAEIVKAWVAALLSGEYKQGKFYLRHEDKYCCLGVLCELAVKAGVIVPGKPSLGSADKVTVYVGETKTLPREVAWWAGVGANPQMSSTGHTLGYLNDNGMKFPDIAELIRANLHPEPESVSQPDGFGTYDPNDNGNQPI